MRTKESGRFCQRVGTLIEQYICHKMQLTFNKRQQTKGYYDAYDQNTVYEIKATRQKVNTFLIKESNHKELLTVGGSYIFVCYQVKDNDKNLQVISDIDILDIVTLTADKVNILMESSVSKSTVRNKVAYRKVKIGNVHKIVAGESHE